MSENCATLDSDLLSAYVDEELGRQEKREVESHLADCGHCRMQLNSLARVAGSLQALERVAPPPVLDEMVLGRLEVRGARAWTTRVDAMLTSTQRTRSTVGPTFALVMMLVLLVFFFAEALVRRGSQSVVISVPTSVTPGTDHQANSGARVVTSSGRSLIAVFGEDVIPAEVYGHVETGPSESNGATIWAGLADRWDVDEVWLDSSLVTGDLNQAVTTTWFNGCSEAASSEWTVESSVEEAVASIRERQMQRHERLGGTALSRDNERSYLVVVPGTRGVDGPSGAECAVFRPARSTGN